MADIRRGLFFRGPVGPVMPGSWAEIASEFVRVLGNGCLADSSKEKRLFWLVAD